MADTIAIGQTLVVRNGNSVETHTVVGDSPRMWHTQENIGLTSWGSNTRSAKLPKSGKGWSIATEQDIKICEWASHNAQYLSQELAYTHFAPELLLQIAKLIGYKTLPTEDAAAVTV